MIFSSTRIEGDFGFSEMTDKMVELAIQKDGFLIVESVRNEIEIAESHLLSIKKRKENTKHSIAREKGQDKWCESIKTRISKAERDCVFEKE